jgi:hypothetical protein
VKHPLSRLQKSPYRSPELREYGDIQRLTQGNPSSCGVGDGGDGQGGGVAKRTGAQSCNS